MEDRTINILLVEDDEVGVMNVRRALKKNQIANPLYIAENGLKALAMLRSQNGKPPVVPPKRRLILLDLNMPQMNGLEFLRELRFDPQLKATPVIVLTTSDEDRDKLEAYNLNVAGYILKPITFSRFTEVVSTLNQYWMLCEML
ncbi:two-component system response regulator [Hydrococcus rivularis NIES-593]|uniref:Two-component system response regulator n=1 Tax=Hydrococcus rivularis NIES-593 TaxID=1921803 RepID=A0A1U7H7P1_9CYAN|nr:two-component system response regulator [Hydrococcus rivularis NIES-593]